MGATSARYQCRICGKHKYANDFKGDPSCGGVRLRDTCIRCENDPGPKPGYIYVIRCQEYYKIGRTLNPVTRKWETDNPFPIDLVHVFPSKRTLTAERFLHAKFAEYRHQGEWFTLPDEALRWFQSVQDIDGIATSGV